MSRFNGIYGLLILSLSYLPAAIFGWAIPSHETAVANGNQLTYRIELSLSTQGSIDETNNARKLSEAQKGLSSSIAAVVDDHGMSLANQADSAFLTNELVTGGQSSHAIVKTTCDMLNLGPLPVNLLETHLDRINPVGPRNESPSKGYARPVYCPPIVTKRQEA